MKIIFFFALLFVMFSMEALAATRGDMRVLEEVDRIRFDINRISKNYLVYLLYPKKIYYKNALAEWLDTLNDDTHNIAISTKDKKTKDILKYFAYEQIQMEDLVQQKPTVKPGLLLDLFALLF